MELRRQPLTLILYPLSPRRSTLRGERVWLLGTRYDPIGPGWLIDIMRQGAAGRWVRQRYMFDEAAQVLHYRGESTLGDAEFRTARREGSIFEGIAVGG